MAGNAGTLEVVTKELVQAFILLQEVMQPEAFADLLRDLGIDDPPDLTADTTFSGKLSDVVDAAAELDQALVDLTVAIGDDSVSQIISIAAELLADIGLVGIALDAVAADLRRVAVGTPAEAALTALADEFSGRVIEEVVTRYLEVTHPVIERLLRFIGVITRNIVVLSVAGTPTPFVRRRLFVDRLPKVATDPVGLLTSSYQWGTQNLDETALFRNVADLFDALGPMTQLPSDGAIPGDLADNPIVLPGLDFFGLAFDRSSEPPPEAPGIQGTLFANVGVDQQLVLAQLGDTWKLALNLGGSYDNGLAIKVLPPLKLQFTPPGAGTLQGQLALQFTGQNPDPNGRINVFSITSGCKIDAQSLTAGLLADLVFDAGTGKANADLGFRFHAQGGRILISLDSNNEDGFLAKVLPAKGIEIDFDLGIKWTPSQGLQIEGSAGLELNVPINRSLGPIKIAALKLDAKVNSQAIFFSAGVTASLALGPVVATLQNVGVGLNVDLGSRGSLGNADLSVKFKPPTGVGIAVNAGPISGGGFLTFEPDIGRYTGAVELSVYGVAVKAFGVIETKVPGGGFSFVIVISAEFANPIQLGFGFTLNGVGGLVGINRTVNADALQGLITSGTASHLLFPENVIGNAPAIIRDLTTVFPAREGRYLFGPIARLGWGTPTLIRGDLGLILEIPGPVLTILGEIRALLPKPEAPLVKFNLSVGGRLDFANKSFSLDAVLHDSVINGFPVSGQMAMRLRWGDNPSFALAIGGFHPSFQPPSNFPKTLQPLTVVLAQKANVSATVSGFFAITPNTLQVGGEARLHATGGGLSLDASVSVKAIFIFSPFSFVANIDASVKISFHGYGPSVHLRGLLSGPSPWRVQGEVCVSLYFWDACLGFDQEFGGKVQVAQAEINPWLGSAEIVGLKTALEDPKNWAAVQPAGSYAVVSLVPGADSMVDPGGSFSVRQKVVPVETDSAIARLGTAKAKEPGRTTPIFYKNMQAALVGVGGGTLSTIEKVLDFFAPAQFFEMNEAKKLSAPSFEKKQAGYVLAGNTGSTQVGSVSFKEMKYDTVILGTAGTTSQGTEYDLPDAQLGASSTRNAVARGGFGRGGVNRFINPTTTPAFAIQDVGFVLTSSRDLVRLNPNAASLSRTDALIALDAHIALHPEQAGFVQIVPLHELQAA